MKFRIRPAESDWHSWFAWYPVRLTRDRAEVVWLQKVERRYQVGTAWGVKRWTEYRLPGTNTY